jgi:hypothetical protein
MNPVSQFLAASCLNFPPPSTTHWQDSAERAANEVIIESLLEVPTKYEVYHIGSREEGLGSWDPGHEFDEVS